MPRFFRRELVDGLFPRYCTAAGYVIRKTGKFVVDGSDLSRYIMQELFRLNEGMAEFTICKQHADSKYSIETSRQPVGM
ncbi:MAG: hypothetical protein AVO35_12840 [Candidatus Aegiribacteria sp. MLS_C]|jgi:hypothetical protein|nr:MAG: hypothetical protein AVO35_12840 [Candidatus Aegiribacteria sp. MLS_C]